MTTTPNTVTSVVSGIAQTVATDVTSALGANATATVTKAETAATTEVTSISTHWHIPVWTVLVVLAVAGWAVLHFVL
jgi:hypothetical protein